MDGRSRRRGPGAVLAGLLGLAACGGAEPAPDASAPKAPPAPSRREATPPSRAEPGGKAPVVAVPGVQPDGEIVSAVAWFEGSLEQALAKAKAEDKLVFMDVGAYWCPPCHQLDEEVFVRAEVGEALGRGYVAVHVDAEKGEGPELVGRYHVQAFPTMLVLEASGVEKGRIVDFLEPAALVEALSRIAQGANVLAALADEVEANPDDLAKRYALGHAYLLAADAASARPQFEAVQLGDPTNELGLTARVLYDRALFQTFKLEGEPERAIEEFRALQRRFPDSREAVRAYRDIGRLLCTLGREDEAVASLQAMLATGPDDPGLASSFGWFAFRERCGVAAGLAAVQRGIVHAPRDADLRYVEAELLHLLARDAEGLAAIREASALEPKTAFYRRQVRRFEALEGEAG